MHIILKILLISIISISTCFSQGKIEPPAISINSLFLKHEIKNGIPFYWYEYKDKKIKNFKYRILVNKEVNYQSKVKDRGRYEGDDIRKTYSDYSYGKFTGIILEGSFRESYKDGLWKTTYENKLVKTENYNNGLMVGRYRVYNTDGVMLYKTTFGSQGDGKYQDYHYPTGVIKEEGFYKNGVKDGEWCTYDEKGRIVESTVYKDGVIQK
ncbi:MAG: toxin-antitoxin system YwqK family antitoxin [Aequorivita sp.]